VLKSVLNENEGLLLALLLPRILNFIEQFSNNFLMGVSKV